MSEAEFKAHYAWLNPIASAIKHSQRKSGTWSERHNRQQIAFKKAESQGYYSAWKEQSDIQNDPINIARWKEEAQAIIDIENKRLAVIEANLEAERVAAFEAHLESERLIELELAKQRAIDEYITQQNELVELQRVEDERLIESKRVEEERVQTQNLLEAEKQIEVDIQNKKKTIATALIIGGIGLGLFTLSKRKSFK